MAATRRDGNSKRKPVAVVTVSTRGDKPRPLVAAAAAQQAAVALKRDAGVQRAKSRRAR